MFLFYFLSVLHSGFSLFKMVLKLPNHLKISMSLIALLFLVIIYLRESDPHKTSQDDENKEMDLDVKDWKGETCYRESVERNMVVEIKCIAPFAYCCGHPNRFVCLIYCNHLMHSYI